MKIWDSVYILVCSAFCIVKLWMLYSRPTTHLEAQFASGIKSFSQIKQVKNILGIMSIYRGQGSPFKNKHNTQQKTQSNMWPAPPSARVANLKQYYLQNWNRSLLQGLPVVSLMTCSGQNLEGSMRNPNVSFGGEKLINSDSLNVQSVINASVLLRALTRKVLCLTS